MIPIESLHNHTILSDGKMKHRELFELSQSLGISVIAFTDHDAVPSQSILAELETLRPRSTKWIIGAEITAGLPRELSPQTGVMHIIGLFLDPTNEELIEHCKRAQVARVKRMNDIVSNLQKLDFKITAEDCLEMSGGESIGRPHIIQALQKYPENNIVQEKIRLEMADEASHNPDVQRQYARMMQKGERDYPYTLFLSPEAFKSAYAEHEYMPDLDQAVKIIRDAGGVAILAHYFTIRPKLPLELLDEILRDKRLDGVEVVYGLREYGTIGEREMSEERNSLREMAKKYGAIIAGGADAHSTDDVERYAMNDWFASESVGFAEKIVEYIRAQRSEADANLLIQKFSSL